MKGYNFTYFLREGVRGVFLHGVMSFAAVGVIACCLVITGSFFLVSLNVNAIISEAESQNEIVAFVDEALSEAEARRIGGQISLIENVEEWVFVTKEEAFQLYAESLGEESYLLEGLEEDNPLRHRYRIFMKDISLMKDTTARLQAIEGIDRVSASEEISETFLRLRSIINYVAYILAALLIGVSVFIIANTIRLATFTRREEIAIMKMVGATNAFIRWPFVFEGFILGLCGAVTAYFVQWGVYEFAVKRMTEQAQMLSLVPFAEIRLLLFLAFLATGFLVGIGGSVLTIRKFMQV